jgi:hypothetical protein
MVFLGHPINYLNPTYKTGIDIDILFAFHEST